MTPTEEICARLDELGVEYDTYDLPNGEHGLSWIDGNSIEWEAVQQGENFRIHALQLVTPEQAIAATVGERNPDGLPIGLTISNDGNLLNWMGENYMRQDAATVGVDTCKCVGVTPNDWDEDLTMYHMECGFTMLHGEDKPRFCGGCGRRLPRGEIAKEVGK
jgi:hypothetical protein